VLCSISKLDLDKIIEEDSQNPRLVAAAHIRHFLSEIQTTIKLSSGSIHNYRHVLRHFYEMNDITLNWKKISKFSRIEYSTADMRQKDRGLHSSRNSGHASIFKREGKRYHPLACTSWYQSRGSLFNKAKTPKGLGRNQWSSKGNAVRPLNRSR